MDEYGWRKSGGKYLASGNSRVFFFLTMYQNSDIISDLFFFFCKFLSVKTVFFWFHFFFSFVKV